MSSPVWHPFTQHGLDEEIPRIERAEGAVLHAADGRRYVDAISSWWVTTHGHCNPRIMAAIRAQTEKLDQLIFAGWTHEPAETLARALVDITPAGLDHVFFSDSGSTSVEVALKMALGTWLNRGKPRHRIVVMEHSYHGDTIGAMSVGERGVYNRAYQPLLFDVDTLPFPTGDGDRTIAALEAICAQDPPPAALIVEPLILGAGGMLIYPPHVLKALRDICAREGVLFIADEVMTGWGRTGMLFACQHAGVKPDLMCLSKGLTGGAIPLAATLATRDIFDAHLSQDRATMFFHSSSYTANPIACAAANANIAIWQEEPVLDRIGALVHRQARRLDRLDHPLIVGKRQLGTITAMEFVDPYGDYLSAMAPMLGRFFRDNGLLLRPMGNTIYVMPPYCIDDKDLDAIYDAILAAALEMAA
ncbi:adenosylmethionine--8-amino-7-oxononanoate transaminase [Rhizorhabdus histidinilytica]|uniref:Adenosylmethionine-8-amino-7-oxononanoate aminotransferase n=1 Tax=Rhizorhabdus histidinilytica TaxID=439228 RepID=A0A1T5BYJ2_9SPHN|nr:adenosylmethionine--8-amino-7-oxononanoate transaminase [Rhizorhabdus histidinilytica]SKB52428.1 adenosylmethionine-8-amino-7-oxononanoate aminotransferase [Rhizorhabdus histidinilytica]